ncbi:MAG: S8 family serine peptidase [Parcubacteria group bacterium]|nr:S8 family serine peptidase [Parcubacteria group bacterium]
MVKYYLKFFISIALLLTALTPSALALYPNDPGMVHQWYLKQVQAPEAWDIVTGSEDVVVAVLDSGVDINHPDLKDNIWQNPDEIPNDKIDNDGNGYIDDVHGWDFIVESSDPSPKYDAAQKGNIIGVSHGTIISGIIAARGNNQEGIAGISWKSKIMPLRVLDVKGVGTASTIVKAIDYAVLNKAHVINMSFIGIGKSSLIEDAVIRAYQSGVIIVAAGGNESNQYFRYPIDLDKTPGAPVCSAAALSDRRVVIGVASTDTLDQKSLFSNYGTSCIDISAPGFGFYSTIVKDPDIGAFQYYGGLFSGTSLSTPIVAGAAALIRSLPLKLSNKQIIDLLLESADPIADLGSEFKNSMGTGRLNVRKAVELALQRYDPLTYRRLIMGGETFESKVAVFSDTDFSSDVELYDLTDSFAVFDKTIKAFPFRFKGGIRLALSSKTKNLWVAPGSQGGPQLRQFDAQGKLKRQQFIGDSQYRGGLDIDLARGKNNQTYFIVGQGKDAEPKVLILDASWNKIKEFLAYAPSYRGGVKVAAGDINGDGLDEIITGAADGGGPHVRIFDLDGRLVSQFFAYDKNTRKGLNIAAGDINKDGIMEVITAPGAGLKGAIKIFDRRGTLIQEFYPFGADFDGGVSVTCLDTQKDGIVEIVAATGPGAAPQVAVFDQSGARKYQFSPFFNDRYYGGLIVKAIK